MTSIPAVPEITVQDLKSLHDEGKTPYLLDVREEKEYAIAHLGGELIPLHELPQRIDELEAQRNAELIVVYCRSGSRSARAVQFLQAMGFDNVRNLKGGILAWSREIDPSVPTY